MEFATKTIHAGQPSEPETGSLIAPIFQTSTYEQDEPGRQPRLRLLADEQSDARAARRRCSPSSKGWSTAPRSASGLAAENAVLQAYLEAGRRDRHPARRLRRHVSDPEQGVPAARLRDQADRPRAIDGALEAALSPKTKLVWIESPTNPRLLVYDIAAIAAATHAAGALLVVDNTFATPLFQQPFQLGADLVVHSVTKYLAGHSDVIQGAVLANEAVGVRAGEVPAERDGRRPRAVRLLAHAARAEDPRAADAAARRQRGGDRQRAERAPAREARLLPRPATIIPATTIAKRQMTGFGGMVSFELNGTVEEVVSFVSSRRFFALGESLGGVKALVCHPARMTHASIPAEERAKLGLSDTLVRLSTGCEHQRDLVADLEQGLAELEQARQAVAAIV